MAKKTNIEFLKELSEMNTNIKPLEEYIGYHVKILCECLICEHQWRVEPSKLLHGRGCPLCANRKRHKGKYKVSKEEFMDKTLELGYIPMEEYKGLSTTINFICNKCGNNIHTTPHRIFFEKTGCKNCYSMSLRKTNEQFIEELSKINPDIYPLSEYVNAFTKIEYKCNICGLIHKATPSNLLKGYGCPNCCMSKGEKRCKKYFDEHNIQYFQQYEFDDLIGVGGNNLRFDFGVIYNNKLLLVEYDGVFHYEQQYENDGFDIIKIHDNFKNEYCKKNNIKLIRIPYWKYDDIEEILNKALETML